MTNHLTTSSPTKNIAIFLIKTITYFFHFCHALMKCFPTKEPVGYLKTFRGSMRFYRIASSNLIKYLIKNDFLGDLVVTSNENHQINILFNIIEIFK